MDHLTNNTQTHMVSKDEIDTITKWYNIDPITRNTLNEMITNMASHNNSKKHEFEKNDQIQTTPRKRKEKLQQ